MSKSVLFDKVLGAVNGHKNRNFGKIPKMGELLAEISVSPSEWYAALAWARINAPETYAQFYKAIGKEPRKVRDPELETESDPSDEDESTPASRIDVLSNCMQWLETLEKPDRASVIKSITAFYAE